MLWNRPEGGFFVTLRTPFRCSMAMVERCAEEAGVIAVPLSLFGFETSCDDGMRLSFSAVPANQIEEGVQRMARFLASY